MKREERDLGQYPGAWPGPTAMGRLTTKVERGTPLGASAVSGWEGMLSHKRCYRNDFLLLLLLLCGVVRKRRPLGFGRCAEMLILEGICSAKTTLLLELSPLAPSFVALIKGASGLPRVEER